jgi:hypothetical protein
MYETLIHNNANGQVNGTSCAGGKKTIGEWISIIHAAIKSDRIMDVVVECLKEGMNDA